MKFSQRLKELRKEKNLTQVELGSMLNYGYTTIANYENGRNHPSLKDIIRIANIFDVSVDYLIGNSDVKYMERKNLWYKKIMKQLKQNDISLKNTDYFFMELLYYQAKKIFTEKNNMPHNVEQLFEEAVQKSLKSFSEFLLLLLQNRLYYDVIKNGILEEFNIENNEKD